MTGCGSGVGSGVGVGVVSAVSGSGVSCGLTATISSANGGSSPEKSSSGSFFADATVRLTSYPKAYYSPYYYGGYDMYDKDGNHVYMGQPLITLNRRIVDVLVTFGWRF